MRLRLACAVLALAFGVVGCGSGREQTVKVNGTLTWEEDGKPIGQAQVDFIPQGDGRPASGFTSDDGRFSLTTFNSGDGAVPGKYKVTVVKRDLQKVNPTAKVGTSLEDMTKAAAQVHAEMKSGKKTDKSPAATSLLPAMYSTVDKTPLVVTVESGSTEVKLTLKKS